MRHSIEDIVLKLVVGADIDVGTLVAGGVDVVGSGEDYFDFSIQFGSCGGQFACLPVIHFPSCSTS